MICFIISLVLFLLTIPLRSLKFVVSMNIRLLQASKRMFLRTRGRVGGNGVVGKTAKAGGKAVAAGGKAIQASGKATKATGKAAKAGASVAGTGVKGAGKVTKGVGKAVSIIPGVGTVVGGAAQIAGTGVDAAGSATKTAGSVAEKGLNAAGDIQQVAGEKVELLGNKMQNVGGMSSTDIAKKTAGLPVQAAILGLKLFRKALTALILFIGTLSKMFSVIAVLVIIVLVVLISTVLSVVGVFETTIMDSKIDWHQTTQQSSSSNNSKVNVDKRGGKADIDGWLAACEECMRKLCALKRIKYISDNNQKQDTPYGKARIDCSGYVYLCLVEYGVFKANPKGVLYSFGSSGIRDEAKNMKGWEVLDLPNTEKEVRQFLKAGDICVIPGVHADVYAGKGGKDEWWNEWGTGHGVWMPKDAHTVARPWWFGNLASAKDSFVVRLKGGTANSNVTIGGDIKGLVYPKDVKGMAKMPVFYQSIPTGTEFVGTRAFQTKKGKKYGEQYMPGYIGQSDKEGAIIMAGRGCSFCAAAMVATYLSGKDINPIKLCELLSDGNVNKKTPYYTAGDGGSGQNIAEDLAEKCGFTDKVKKTKSGNYYIHFSASEASASAMQPYFDKGAVGFMSAGQPWAAGTGHYLAIRGMVNGKVCINDPNASAYSRESLVSKSSNHMHSRSEYWVAKFDWDSEVKPYLRNGVWLFVPKTK